MKLSTAMRIGSMTTKQITVNFTDGGNGRCALGAALDAVSSKGQDFAAAWSIFPLTLLRSVGTGDSLAFLISQWNDNDGRSREWIADRVEQVEAHLESLEHDGYLSTGVVESKPLELIAQESK